MLTARGRRTITLGLIAVPRAGYWNPGVSRPGYGCRRRHSGGTDRGPRRQMHPHGHRTCFATCGERGRAGCARATIEAPGGAGSLSVPVTLQTDHSLRPVPHQPTRITVPRLVRDGGQWRGSRSVPSARPCRRRRLRSGDLRSARPGRAACIASRPTRCVVLPRIEHSHRCCRRARPH